MLCEGGPRGGRFGLLEGSQGARREGEESGDQREDAAHNHADEPEGKKQKPYDGIKNQRQQSSRPAQNQQDEEEEELHDVGRLFPLRCTQYRAELFPVFGGMGEMAERALLQPFL